MYSRYFFDRLLCLEIQQICFFLMHKKQTSIRETTVSSMEKHQRLNFKPNRKHNFAFLVQTQ
jgi:hypothetical protein